MSGNNTTFNGSFDNNGNPMPNFPGFVGVPQPIPTPIPSGLPTFLSPMPRTKTELATIVPSSSSSTRVTSKTTSAKRKKPGESGGDDEDEDGKIPSFIQKLMNIVNDPSTDNLISWSESGDMFRVHDASGLAKEILPKYFKHNNFNSLVRQLNMYGFHKVVGLEGGIKGEQEEWEFVHPCVRRDKPLWLHHIKRKDPAHKRQVTRKEVDGVVRDLHTIKDEQQILSSKFMDMQRENTALWQEVSQLRQKNQQQHRMISKILEFLHKLSRRDALQATSSSNPPKRNKQLSIGMSQTQQQIPSQPTMADFDPSLLYQAMNPQQDNSFQQLDMPFTMPNNSSTLPTSSSSTFPLMMPNSPPNFSDQIQNLGNLHDRETIEHVLSPTITGHNARIGEQRQRLESLGLDPSLLHGLWSTADDHAREEDLPLDVFSPSTNIQPNVVYSPLDEFGANQQSTIQ
eukprot:m.29016 g.29016  ORF g.29016 m.29016 type:complete len:456 (-) comp6114_c0_seq1:1043-2410(-)